MNAKVRESAGARRKRGSRITCPAVILVDAFVNHEISRPLRHLSFSFEP